MYIYLHKINYKYKIKQNINNRLIKYKRNNVLNGFKSETKLKPTIWLLERMFWYEQSREKMCGEFSEL